MRLYLQRTNIRSPTWLIALQLARRPVVRAMSSPLYKVETVELFI